MYEKITFIVSGIVQGVCFRAYTQRAALKHDVTGWVRNRPDGSVDGEAFGTPEAVKGFVAWLHEGSPHGRVDHVNLSRDGSREERPPSFEVRY
ncbi:MAG: acylphosphatase [Planctomycetota bacterium]|jgi:acylphosphatase